MEKIEQRWTLEEDHVLKEVRRQLRHELENRPQYPDVVGDRKLIRFIRGHKLDVAKSVEMIGNFLKWRDANNVDRIRNRILFGGVNHWTKFPNGQLISDLIKTVVIAPSALDKNNSPICVEQYNFSPGKVLNHITLEQYIEYVVYSMEYKNLILEQLSEERERKIRSEGLGNSLPCGVTVQTCVIRDIGGVGLEHMGSQGQDIIKAVIGVASDNYPELMRKCYLVNAPWVFGALWFFVKSLLAERTVEKVSVFGSNFLSELEKDISLANVPTLLPGGTYETSDSFWFDITVDGPFRELSRTELYDQADTGADLTKLADEADLPRKEEDSKLFLVQDKITTEDSEIGDYDRPLIDDSLPAPRTMAAFSSKKLMSFIAAPFLSTKSKKKKKKSTTNNEPMAVIDRNKKVLAVRTPIKDRGNGCCRPSPSSPTSNFSNLKGLRISSDESSNKNQALASTVDDIEANDVRSQGNYETIEGVVSIRFTELSELDN